MGATVTRLVPRGRQSWMKLRSRQLLLARMVERGESNRSLALRSRCSHAFISQLRTGRLDSCTPLMAQRIERALAVAPGTLFTARVSSGERAA